MKRQTIQLHAQPVTYYRAGQGLPSCWSTASPSSARTWREVMPGLAENHEVIASDLLGHGHQPRGDYSLGNYASSLRDLLSVLEIGRATVVGHSLRGGVAMQFAYQFPNRLGRQRGVGERGRA